MIELGAPLDADFFVCGPATMMNDVVGGLQDCGVDSNRVHFESFGPATVTNSTKQVADGGGSPDEKKASYTVDFQLSNKTVDQVDPSLTLLEAAEEAGVAIESGCRAGSCGTCLTAILSGEVEYIEEAGIDIESGSCLPCIAVPKSNIKLDA